jgi:hypothetical protein
MWFVESLIVDVTPISGLQRERLVDDHLHAILCSSDYDEHAHSLSPVATWDESHIAQKKAYHNTRYEDFNYGARWRSGEYSR